MDWLIHYCIAKHVWIFVQSYDMIMIWFQLPDSSLCVGNEKESMNQWMILVTKHMSLPDMIFQNTGATKKKTIITLSTLACHHTFSVCHWLPIYIPGSINMHTLHVWSHLNFNSTTLSIKQASAPASAKDLPTHDNELTWPACVQRVTTHSPLLVQHVNFWIHWWERAKNHTVIL